MTDDKPRYVVDLKPTVRVLDTAYCWKIIKEYGGGQPNQGVRKQHLRQAEALAAELNAEDYP